MKTFAPRPAPEPEPEPEPTPTVDECVTPSADASANCNTIAQTEGNGSYTQDTNGTSGASGRYQITQNTAVGLIQDLNLANSKSSATSLWQQCRNSDSADCRKLQDSLCNSYSTQLSKGLTGDKNKFKNFYLRWNMGPTGANEILNAYPNKITNPERIALMDNQAWARPPTGSPSNGDTQKFLNGMNSYIRSKKVDPNASL